MFKYIVLFQHHIALFQPRILKVFTSIAKFSKLRWEKEAPCQMYKWEKLNHKKAMWLHKLTQQFYENILTEDYLPAYDGNGKPFLSLWLASKNYDMQRQKNRSRIYFLSNILMSLKVQILFNSLFLIKIFLWALSNIFSSFTCILFYIEFSIKYFWKVYQINPTDSEYALNGTLG